MRLRADQKQAKDLLQVLLDGRPVPMVWQVDDKEGWVESYLPKIPDQIVEGKVGEEIEVFNLAEWELVKRTGEVELIWKTDNDTSLDNK